MTDKEHITNQKVVKILSQLNNFNFSHHIWLTLSWTSDTCKHGIDTSLSESAERNAGRAPRRVFKAPPPAGYWRLSLDIWSLTPHALCWGPSVRCTMCPLCRMATHEASQTLPPPVNFISFSWETSPYNSQQD